MCYTRISNSRDGKACIRYVMHKKGHNGAEARNEIVSGINLLPDAIIPFSVQMDKNWQKASSRNKVRVHRIVQSFSREELDPDNTEDVAIAHEIGVRTAKELYGEDCQCIVATQTDGEGHLVHNHILVSNVTMNGTGLTNERTFHPNIRRKTDEITAQFIDIPDAEPAQEVITPEVRGMRTSNADAAEGETRYIWQDDLRQRIRDAATVSKDMDGFFLELQRRGVKGVAKKATKTQPDYILYELIDKTGFDGLDKVPKNLKSKSFKMGVDFQPEGIEKTIQKNQTEKEDDNMLDLKKMSGLTAVKDLTSVKDSDAVTDAEDTWSAVVRSAFAEFKGWEAGLPTERDEVFGLGVNPGLLMQHAKEKDAFEMQFKLHQNELKQNGVELPPIFYVDKYETIFVDRIELRRQVNDYIFKKYAKASSGSGKKEEEEKAGVTSSANKSIAAGGSEKGRKEKKQTKRLLTPEARERRNPDTEELFAKVREMERRAREKEDDFELEF